MLIKSSDDRTRDIDTLTALLSDPAASPRARQDIDLQIRKIRAGARGEAEAAYEIDFDHKASTNWAVLHDLRLEYQGRVAQIDHLMINRCLDIWVCESKHFQQGVAINEHGEFTAFHGNRATGIPSPLEQNRKHLEVLRAVLDSSLVRLPTRLGMAIRPTLHSVVLVSKNARITRPDKPVPGIEAVVKSDRLRDLINRRVEANSTIGTLVSVAKMVAPETLESFARQLATLHRPGSFDWAAKFGIARAAQRMPAAASPDAASAGRASAASPSGAPATTPVRTVAPADAPSAEADVGSSGAPDPWAAPAGPVRSSPETPVRPFPHPYTRQVAAAAPSAMQDVPDTGAATMRTQASNDARADPPARPPSTGPATAKEVAGTTDDGVERLSTSKLGARLGARNAAETLDRLVRAGYLAPDGAGHALTEKGRACGAVFVEKSRFGPYFLWPSDLKP